MHDKSLIALTLTVAATATLAACGGGGDQSAATTTSAAATTTTASAPNTAAGTASSGDSSARAYRARVVEAANAWLKTLTASQRQTATYSFDDTASKQQWSNFPAFFKPRTGVAYKDTSAASDNAALALAKTVLSSQGYTQYQGIRAADDDLGKTDSAGFGAGNYYTSVFGTPSASKPFMISLNGHHMSFNITFGTRLSSTPEFTGVEPSSFQVDSQTVQPMKDEADAVFGLLPKLPAKATLRQSFDDVVVGPQKDGQFPAQHEGVKVTDLPADVQQKVTDLIGAYVGDVPAAISKSVIAGYKKEYANTYISYAGSTKDQPGTYVRVDGPGVWIELAVQTTDKGSSHYHSVYRDKRHDYGA
jgi:uncharacterized protein DUF3500